MRCRYFYLRAAAALGGAAVGAEAELGVLHPLGGEVLALTPAVYYLDPRNGECNIQYIVLIIRHLSLLFILSISILVFFPTAILTN